MAIVIITQLVPRISCAGIHTANQTKNISQKLVFIRLILNASNSDFCFYFCFRVLFLYNQVVFINYIISWISCFLFVCLFVCLLVCLLYRLGDVHYWCHDGHCSINVYRQRTKYVRFRSCWVLCLVYWQLHAVVSAQISNMHIFIALFTFSSLQFTV